MCGIVACISKNKNAIRGVLEGIGLLEHRGYDSLGIAYVLSDNVRIKKISQAEKKDFSNQDLAKLLPASDKSQIALAHTRWATFGGINEANAHPHFDEKKEFYLAHNGNVENLAELEEECGSWQRYSETDTEAIVNLLAKYYFAENDFVSAVKKTMNFIEGANAIVVIKKDEPDKIIAANKGGALILATTDDGVLVASDPAAFESWEIKKTKILQDNEIAIMRSTDWELLNNQKKNIKHKNFNLDETSRGKYDFFMEKEIFEQAGTLANTLRGRIIAEQGNSKLGGIEDLSRELRKSKTFHFVGCGTAYNSCLYAELLANRFGIPAKAWIASEFCDSYPVFAPGDTFIFISQSGETADTIQAMNEVKIKGNICLGIINTPGSRIWRESDAGIAIRAGKEKGVASTKAFTSQLAAIVLLLVFLARQRQMTASIGGKVLNELEQLPKKVEQILKQAEQIKKLTAKYKSYKNYYFLGRYFNYISSAEGSLKLKEISYVHAESYPLGEMKHGPLALVDKDFCNIVICPNDSVYKKSLVNMQEIKARSGQVLLLANKQTNPILADDTIIIPETEEFLSPILMAIPLQLFSYYMTLALDFNPDRPRNLAKTVTVS